MPEQGNANQSLRYGSVGNSTEINRRQVNIEPTGIYQGGYLSVVDSSHASISPLVCSIASGRNQIRVETTTAVNLLVGSSIPYIVLRWTYTGAVTDYMELLAVGAGSILEEDLIVGKCSFSGGATLIGFDYEDTDYPRSHPNVQALNLKVLPPIETDLRVWVNPGKVQVGSQTYNIPLQQTDYFTLPASNSKVYLVYVDTSDGTIKIDTSGTAAASPVAPAYNGKLVLAEVTLASTATTIEAENIKDKRMFVSARPMEVDDTTIELSSAGLLKTIDPKYLVMYSTTEQCSAQSSWTKLSLTQAKASGISQTSSVVTLTAGYMYQVSFSAIFRYISDSYPMYCGLRIRVLTGDLSWELKDDDNNVSRKLHDDGAVTDLINLTLSGSVCIVPASNSTLQLEALTSNGSSRRSKVVHCSLNISRQ